MKATVSLKHGHAALISTDSAYDLARDFENRALLGVAVNDPAHYTGQDGGDVYFALNDVVAIHIPAR